MIAATEHIDKNHRGRRFRPSFLLSVVVVSVFLIASALFAQTVPSNREKLIEEAKREGKLVWYATLTSSESRALLTLFEQKYPFIRTTHYGANSERLLNRIFTEERSGQHFFDVVNFASINMLKKNNLLAPYRSVETPVYPASFRDPQDYWTSLYDLRYVLGFNTALVKTAEAPRDWTDLLDSKWRGKFGLEKEEYEWYAGLLEHWGESKTRNFMKALSRQDINWRKGHSLLAQLMAAGEFPLALVYLHRIEAMKQLGAPVEWVKTTNPILVGLGPIAISAKAAHPAAAKLFVDFSLSREAQLVLGRSHRFSGRQDVEVPLSGAEVSKPKFAVIDPKASEDLAAYGKKFDEIFFR
jgi:iron(III) transport system substrate-binding protein